MHAESANFPYPTNATQHLYFEETSKCHRHTYGYSRPLEAEMGVNISLYAFLTVYVGLGARARILRNAIVSLPPPPPPVSTY